MAPRNSIYFFSPGRESPTAGCVPGKRDAKVNLRFALGVFSFVKSCLSPFSGRPAARPSVRRLFTTSKQTAVCSKCERIGERVPLFFHVIEQTVPSMYVSRRHPAHNHLMSVLILHPVILYWYTTTTTTTTTGDHS